MMSLDRPLTMTLPTIEKGSEEGVDDVIDVATQTDMDGIDVGVQTDILSHQQVQLLNLLNSHYGPGLLFRDFTLLLYSILTPAIVTYGCSRVLNYLREVQMPAVDNIVSATTRSGDKSDSDSQEPSVLLEVDLNDLQVILRDHPSHSRVTLCIVESSSTSWMTSGY